jgi:hypothetical protein
MKQTKIAFPTTTTSKRNVIEDTPWTVDCWAIDANRVQLQFTRDGRSIGECYTIQTTTVQEYVWAIFVAFVKKTEAEEHFAQLVRQAR